MNDRLLKDIEALEMRLAELLWEAISEKLKAEGYGHIVSERLEESVYTFVREHMEITLR